MRRTWSGWGACFSPAARSSSRNATRRSRRWATWPGQGAGEQLAGHCQLEQFEGDFRPFACAIDQVACTYEAYVVRRTSRRPQVDSALRGARTSAIRWAIRDRVRRRTYRPAGHHPPAGHGHRGSPCSNHHRCAEPRPSKSAQTLSPARSASTLRRLRWPCSRTITRIQCSSVAAATESALCVLRPRGVLGRSKPILSGRAAGDIDENRHLLGQRPFLPRLTHSGRYDGCTGGFHDFRSERA